MTSLTQRTVYTVLALTVTSAFNIEIQNPTVFRGSSAGSYFGYRVRRFGSDDGDTRFLVSAPLEREGNRSGALYKCNFDSSTCDSIPLPGTEHFHLNGIGLSLTVAQRTSPKLMMCAPSLAYTCGKNTYLNCMCFEFDSSLNLTRNLTPTLQECPRVRLDVAILIDGSASIMEEEFKVMKDFIKTLMRTFQGKDVQFSVSQYSDIVRTEFHFDRFVGATNRDGLIDKITHLRSVTFTPSGIKHVAEEVFREERGARPDALRVMIVITDGESNDRTVTFREAIASADQKSIVRYAIGVGEAFDSGLAVEELRVIASSPAQDHVFKVGNFNALAGLEGQLQHNIFAIEGTGKSSSLSSFKLELAQTGFSSAYSSGSVLLGAVGAYGWAGAMVELQDGEVRVVRGSPGPEGDNAYLGYSVVSVHTRTVSYSVLGAPRYKHIGQVVILERDPQTKQWSLQDSIDGEQIGSYFGAELCSLDVGGDGWTDLLLIGSPLYHSPGVGGIVTVCTISPQGNFSCLSTLRGEEGQTLGRFGSAIAAVGDLNGDGLTDVAVGAPLEDGHRGSVYIYHGMERGISPGYSQRITPPQTDRALKYFGSSVDGGGDLTQDGLSDIIVGAQGRTLVLRSQPVVHLRSTVTVHPAIIPYSFFHCSVSEGVQNNSLQLRVCLNLTNPNTSPHTSGAVFVFLNYTLSLDGERPRSRAVFPGKLRSLDGAVTLTLGESCVYHRVYIPVCVEDYSSPLVVALRYCVKAASIPHLQDLQPAITQPCDPERTTQIPFDMNCGGDGVCVSDLQLSVQLPRTSTLTVYNAAQCTLTLHLSNRKEVSFQTVIMVRHPQGLSFRKVTLLKSTTGETISCADSRPEHGDSVTNCSITQKTFSQSGEVVFNLTLDVSNSEMWNHSIHINVSAFSENEEAATLNDNVISLTVPVRYVVNVLVKGLKSTNYISLSSGSSSRTQLLHRYRVDNLLRRSLPIDLLLLVKMEAHGLVLLDDVDVRVEEGPTQGMNCTRLAEVRGREGTRADEACQGAYCQVARCHLEELAHETPVTFALAFDVTLNSTLEGQEHHWKIWSVAQLQFDRVRYTQQGDGTQQDRFLRANVTTELELVIEVDYIPYIAAGTAGGFILMLLIGLICWKVGFFKRDYKDRMKEDPTQADADGTGEPLNPPPEAPTA